MSSTLGTYPAAAGRQFESGSRYTERRIKKLVLLFFVQNRGIKKPRRKNLSGFLVDQGYVILI